MCGGGGKRVDDLVDAYGRASSRRTTKSAMLNPKILVIGAGAAGLACATELLKSFVNVVVLEAQDRIGGRIYTLPFADNVVDMGAQWCHGEADNVVFDAVKDLDVLESSGDVCVEYDCIRSNGQVVDVATIARLKKLMAKIFMTRYKEMRQFEGSVEQFLSREFFAILDEPANRSIDIDAAREFFENFKRLESCESAAPLSDVSASGLTEYWECDGDYLLNWRDRGYKRFLEIMLNADEDVELGDLDGKIIFNAKVVEILHDRDDARVLVRCEGIERPFLADHVIVTVSMGVLQQCQDTLFNPLLPQQKAEAIDNFGYGNVAKIFMEFPEAFWPHEWTGFNTFWRFEDVVDLNESIRWLQDIYGFYIVNYQPRVLVAWCVGSTATLVEQMPVAEVTEHMMYLLKRFLPKWKIPYPVNVLVSDWMKNPNFRGAYAYRSLYTERTKTSVVSLVQPITVLTHVVNDLITRRDRDSLVALTIKPTVLFAGEATSCHFYSTVHGAVESGLREANRLVGYYNLEL